MARTGTQRGASAAAGPKEQLPALSLPCALASTDSWQSCEVTGRYGSGWRRVDLTQKPLQTMLWVQDTRYVTSADPTWPASIISRTATVTLTIFTARQNPQGDSVLRQERCGFQFEHHSLWPLPQMLFARALLCVAIRVHVAITGHQYPRPVAIMVFAPGSSPTASSLLPLIGGRRDILQLKTIRLRTVVA